MEIHGSSTTFNVENVLRQNILNSDYFRNDCSKLTTWEEVVDEIFYHVDNVEPWLSGNARGPSTAFCLLYRLFTIQLEPLQIRETISHSDSPFIRAVGFLYLRYVCDPKSLWSWYDNYICDEEEFVPSPGGKSVTIGDFVRDLLLDQFYFETIFPRIPKKVQDDIEDLLRHRNLPTVAKGNAGAGGMDRRGTDDGNKRPASVKASLAVAFGQRAPNRAGSREDARGRDHSAATTTTSRGGGGRDGGRGAPRPDYDSKERGRVDERERERTRDEPARRSRSRSPVAVGGYGNSSSYGRDRDPSYGRDRERERERELPPRAPYERSSRDYDRPRGGGGGGGDYDRPRGGGGSGGGRDYGYNRRPRSRSPPGRRSARSRSPPARTASKGRDASDVFRARVEVPQQRVDDLKTRYG